jgi:hypothetical protein
MRQKKIPQKFPLDPVEIISKISQKRKVQFSPFLVIQEERLLSDVLLRANPTATHTNFTLQ